MNISCQELRVVEPSLISAQSFRERADDNGDRDSGAANARDATHDSVIGHDAIHSATIRLNEPTTERPRRRGRPTLG